MHQIVPILRQIPYLSCQINETTPSFLVVNITQNNILKPLLTAQIIEKND